MQEFSPLEQRIIKEKLLIGSTLREMFSTKFMQDSKLEIEVDTTEGHHIFKFYSDTYEANEAVEELINLIDLVSSLEKDRMIRKYFKAATSLTEFEDNETIEIGISKSDKRAKFILPSGAAEDVVPYLHKNLDKTFKATQRLRSIVANNFQSVEERQHRQIVGLTRTANLIAFFSAMAAILAVIYSLTPTAEIEILNERVDIIEAKLGEVQKRSIADSTFIKAIYESLENGRLKGDGP